MRKPGSLIGDINTSGCLSKYEYKDVDPHFGAPTIMKLGLLIIDFLFLTQKEFLLLMN